MDLTDRIECANSIVNGLKPNEPINCKVIYDLQLHLSEAMSLVKNLSLGDVIGISQEEDIYVSHSNDGDDDVYCAFTDKERGQKDCEESGTILSHIKLYRGSK